MAQSNSGSPLPPLDFPSRELPVETISAGTRLVRIHLAEFAPIYFGSKGKNRFDDPRRTFGVCYLAMTEEGAYAETCLLGVGDRYVPHPVFKKDVSRKLKWSLLFGYYRFMAPVWRG